MTSYVSGIFKGSVPEEEIYTSSNTSPQSISFVGAMLNNNNCGNNLVFKNTSTKAVDEASLRTLYRRIFLTKGFMVIKLPEQTNRRPLAAYTVSSIFYFHRIPWCCRQSTMNTQCKMALKVSQLLDFHYTVNIGASETQDV